MSVIQNLINENVRLVQSNFGLIILSLSETFNLADRTYPSHFDLNHPEFCRVFYSSSPVQL